MVVVLMAVLGAVFEALFGAVVGALFGALFGAVAPWSTRELCSVERTPTLLADGVAGAPALAPTLPSGADRRLLHNSNNSSA
jgi:hypothetical protein